MLLQLFVIVSIAVYCWFSYKFQYWKQLGFPYVCGKFPLGSGVNVGSKEHISVFLKREYDRLKNRGPAFGIYIITKAILIPTDPDLINNILVKHFDTFYERGLNLSPKADPLSQHLFFKSGAEWKDLRTKLSSTFTSGKIKMMFPNVVRKVDRMIDYLMQLTDSNVPIEMKDIFTSMAMEVIADVAFGLETNCLGNAESEFKRMGNAVFEPSALENVKLFIIISFERLSALLGIGLNRKSTTNFFIGLVADAINFRERMKVKRNDFLQLLINLRNTEQNISFNEIAAASFGFFLAGFETTSSTSTFMAYELALNQNVQKKLREEINEIIFKYGGELCYEALMEMKYFDMVFSETLRKYPVIDVQRRKSTRDFVIPNTDLIIPAGTTIMVPVYALHNDKRFWENPEDFIPERFAPENIHERHPSTYIPFSDGPRICIGMRFGQMQTKLSLVKLLRHFQILPCDKTILPMKLVPNAVFQCPVGGMWLRLKKLT